jgi:hypothetical protein
MPDTVQIVKARMKEYGATVIVVFLLFRALLAILTSVDSLAESYLVRAINTLIRTTFPNAATLSKIDLRAENLLSTFALGMMFGIAGLLLGYWRLCRDRRLQLRS